MGVASQGWMMALAVAPQMVASLKGPGLMSVISDKVSPEQQGVLQGSVMSLRVISKVRFGPSDVFRYVRLGWSSRLG
jgi:DHA1 family tetracycline resistance protein-like MFS transporter